MKTKTYGEFKITTIREHSTDYSEMNTPEQLAEYWRQNVVTSPSYQQDKELLVVVLLNAKLKPIGWNLVCMGNLDSAPFSPREIMRPVVVGAAKSFVLMHNHPSGDPTPSAADIGATRDIIKCAQLFKTPLVDHVIIGDGTLAFYSLRQNGYV